MVNQIYQGDARTVLLGLPDESVHCCVTSPPYWGLRDYDTAQWEGGDPGCDHVRKKARNDADGDFRPGTVEPPKIQFANTCGKCGARRIDQQLGIEPTPEEYVAGMVEVFREVRRVLRKDGVCWLNLGDSYASSGKGGETRVPGVSGLNMGGPTAKMALHKSGRAPTPDGLKPKDLVGIPWRVAFALQADGWYLRSDVIWSKPNPMPESVTDRPTKSHEYVFMLTKSEKYFYDAEAVREAATSSDRVCLGNRFVQYAGGLSTHKQPYSTGATGYGVPTAGRNKRTVWTIPTQPFSEAHFATFPPALITPMILAGTSPQACEVCGAPWARVVESTPIPLEVKEQFELGRRRQAAETGRTDGYTAYKPHFQREHKTVGWQPTCSCPNEGKGKCIVLDPFAGAGTTALVAQRLRRDYILIELSEEYCQMIKTRLTYRAVRVSQRRKKRTGMRTLF